MNLSEKEAIRTFVRGQLCDEVDLSTLTIRILKSRYLQQVQGDTLSPEAKRFLKEVVQEELIKMQDTYNSESKMETQTTPKKRKRTSDIFSEEEDGSVTKKYRQMPLSEEEETQSNSGSENKKQVVNETESSEDSTDEEQNGAETKRNGGDSPKEASTLEQQEQGTARTSSSCGMESPQSDNDGGDADHVSKSEESKKDTSSDDSDHGNGPNQKPSEKKIKDDTDSDSSSLPSLDDEDDGRVKKEEKEKRKTEGKKKSDNRGTKGEHKSIARLKRFISLCGVRRNYKKLLEGCRSVRSQVAVLKKELEDLGLEGNPSMEKCKKLRLMREEAQELAELDIKNIISTKGRPKRRGTLAGQEQGEPLSMTYSRRLHSDDDSDHNRRISTDWSNLKGIISDDAQSD